MKGDGRRRQGRIYATDVSMHNAVLRLNPTVSNVMVVLEALIKNQRTAIHALLVHSLTISN